MTGLRRSVLALRPTNSGLDPWPPPDADAVPDAVILHAAGSTAAVSAAVEALGRWQVGCILDADADRLADTLVPGIGSVLCRSDTAGVVRHLDAALAAAEHSRALPPGSIGIELLVVEPRAFLDLDDLLGASERVAGVIADVAAMPERFGIELTDEIDQLAYPRGRLILAAARRRLPAVGLFPPAGHHRIAAAGMDAARFSAAIGLQGGLCRTWAEVRACNRGFTPDETRVARARRIIEAMEEAGRQGLGAISLDGRMIDLPFIRVSEAILRVAERTAARAEAVRQMFPARG